MCQALLSTRGSVMDQIDTVASLQGCVVGKQTLSKYTNDRMVECHYHLL